MPCQLFFSHILAKAKYINIVQCIKGYKMSICCFAAKHRALRKKRKDWLARIQDNVSEWGGISIREMLFHHLTED
jgi:hypothetical protein